VGFALDGDADRCVAVDGSGRLVDGDQLLGILALERLERDALDRRSLVVSVLSNGGLQAAVEDAGGRIVRTPVGDKHILAAMLVSGAGLGGEKSGHVIVREHSTSGDGIVTALELLRVMTAAGAAPPRSMPQCSSAHRSITRTVTARGPSDVSTVTSTHWPQPWPACHWPSPSPGWTFTLMAA
jgi:phosphomannomutase